MTNKFNINTYESYYIWPQIDKELLAEITSVLQKIIGEEKDSCIETCSKIVECSYYL